MKILSVGRLCLDRVGWERIRSSKMITFVICVSKEVAVLVIDRKKT